MSPHITQEVSLDPPAGGEIMLDFVYFLFLLDFVNVLFMLGFVNVLFLVDFVNFSFLFSSLFMLCIFKKNHSFVYKLFPLFSWGGLYGVP